MHWGTNDMDAALEVRCFDVNVAPKAALRVLLAE